MPSVLNPAKGMPNDSPDGLEKFSQVVEKKIRNLEKRKTKILVLVDQKKGGKSLEADQVASVNSLPFVEANLEQLKEFLPQFKSISTEHEKARKKAVRREEAKRLDSEHKRAKGVLSTLHYLSLLTLDLKESLLTGLNGLTLTEDEIKTLDLFYTVTDTTSVKFSELEVRLDSATQHITAVLDRKEKEAWEGTKYSDISTLFDKLHEHHVFDPDYVYQPPVEEEPEPEVAPEVEEVTEETEDTDKPEDAPEPEVPVQEEALLNGETTVEPTTDDGLVNFMHDSQLDRSESQLSPHAPEFQPSSSPDLVDQPEKATFGEFSQEDTEVTPEETTPANPTEVVESDPAVMAWSAGPAVVSAEEPAQQESEPVNPWSKKSTIDWGNSSLPVEDSYSSTPVWSTGIENNHSAEVNNHVNNDVTSHVTEPAQDNGWGEQPPVEMKDQTTQKVDDDGFTEVGDKRRGSNRNRYNQRGTTPGSYRNNNRDRGSSNNRYNSSRGSYSRDGRGGSRGGDRTRGDSRDSNRRGGSRSGYGDRGGYSGGRGGSSNRGGSNYRGSNNYRGSSRGGSSRGGSGGSRPQSTQPRSAPVAS